MSTASGLFAMMRDVLLFREHMSVVRNELDGLANDFAQLAKDHAALSNRVARIEGMIEGAAMVAPRRPRLPKA